MAELYPLTRLREPLAFLTGGRLPLHDSGAAPNDEWSWCADYAVRIKREDGKPRFDRLIRNIGTVDWLSLDLTEEATTRWVDRKIAERTGGQVRHAELVIFRGHAEEPWIGWRCGNSQGWTSANNACSWPAGAWTGRDERLNCPALASVAPTEANIPTARSALLDALFGRGEA